MIPGVPSDLHPVPSPDRQQPDDVVLEGMTVEVLPSTEVQLLQDTAAPPANPLVEALSSMSHTEEDFPLAPRGTPHELSQQSEVQPDLDGSHGYLAAALFGDGVPATIDAAIARSSPEQAAGLDPITLAQSGSSMDLS